MLSDSEVVVDAAAVSSRTSLTISLLQPKARVVAFTEEVLVQMLPTHCRPPMKLEDLKACLGTPEILDAFKLCSTQVLEELEDLCVIASVLVEGSEEADFSSDELEASKARFSDRKHRELSKPLLHSPTGV